jgi:hypothetical protein
MPAKQRNYAAEYASQQKRNENPARAKRAAARRMLDAEGVDRTGKDVAHIKALSKGGTNARSNIKLQSPAKNRSFARTKTGAMK